MTSSVQGGMAEGGRRGPREEGGPMIVARGRETGSAAEPRYRRADASLPGRTIGSQSRAESEYCVYPYARLCGANNLVLLHLLHVRERNSSPTGAAPPSRASASLSRALRAPDFNIALLMLMPRIVPHSIAGESHNAHCNDYYSTSCVRARYRARASAR